MALAAKMPASRVPVMPPMPWTPNTSSESSYLKRSLSQVQAQKQTRPATMPMIMPCQGATNPLAGVIVPRPATAPEIMPSTDGLRCVLHSIAPQVSAPAQAARWVALIATTPREFAASAEPPLNPNQPTHNSPVPITASDRSNGDKFSTP